MEEARRPDAAAVGHVASSGDEKHAELALWRLDCRINLSCRHAITLGIELEVMDERLH
jgi:hypothetical protein